MRSGARGFTLVELMVTLSVMVVVTLLLLPGMADFNARNRIIALEGDLLSAVALARSQAARNGVPVLLVAASGGVTGNTYAGGWSLVLDSDGVLYEHSDVSKQSSKTKQQTMKNSKGETLPQPYYDLALMRREQQGGTWDDIAHYTCFSWIRTPEGYCWWCDVDNGETPDIPASSLAELEAWRKSREENKQSEFWGNAAMVADELRPEPDYKAMYEDSAGRYKDLQWTFSELREQKIELEKRSENAPDTTAWKAKYEAADEIRKTIIDTLVFERDELQANHDALEKEANELTAALKELGAKYDELKYGDPSRNWIAECAMAMYTSGTVSFLSDIEYVWDRAEAWAAEGKKRGHLPNNQK